ncbi:MAG: hypothetical protein I3J02_06410 [Prevotella sp.]|nr:hypothetical protein [Prevotella sp.]
MKIDEQSSIGRQKDEEYQNFSVTLHALIQQFGMTAARGDGKQAQAGIIYYF